MVEALLTHGLNGFAARGCYRDGRDGPEAERGNSCAVEGVVLVALAQRKTACDVRGFGCVRRGLGEEVVGREPVVIDELFYVSVIMLQDWGMPYLGEIAPDAVRQDNNYDIVLAQTKLLYGLDRGIHGAAR